MTHDSQPDAPTIAVTPAAKAAIEQLTAANGDIAFHLTSGCCDARTPVCLAAGELKIGPRDRLVGHADGVPVYEMGDGPSRAYEIDVAAGSPVGFSLSPGDGKCFALREARG